MRPSRVEEGIDCDNRYVSSSESESSTTTSNSKEPALGSHRAAMPEVEKEEPGGHTESTQGSNDDAKGHGDEEHPTSTTASDTAEEDQGNPRTERRTSESAADQGVEHVSQTAQTKPQASTASGQTSSSNNAAHNRQPPFATATSASRSPLGGQTTASSLPTSLPYQQPHATLGLQNGVPLAARDLLAGTGFRSQTQLPSVSQGAAGRALSLLLESQARERLAFIRGLQLGGDQIADALLSERLRQQPPFGGGIEGQAAAFAAGGPLPTAAAIPMMPGQQFPFNPSSVVPHAAAHRNPGMSIAATQPHGQHAASQFRDPRKQIAEQSKATASKDPDRKEITSPSKDSGLTKKGKKRKVHEPFPNKLYRILSEMEASGDDDVFSFTADGDCIEVHQPSVFEQEYIPKFFRHSKITSFHRQLGLYGFKRINEGPNTGCYTHPLFIRGQPHLVDQIKRVR